MLFDLEENQVYKRRQTLSSQQLYTEPKLSVLQKHRRWFLSLPQHQAEELLSLAFLQFYPLEGFLPVDQDL
jgi:hypothetical protein